MRFKKKFNAVAFKDFLIILFRHRRSTREIVILLDNAKYHHAQVLQPFLMNHRDRLASEFLPAYGRELSPSERVW